MVVSEIEMLLDWKNDILRRCFFPTSVSGTPEAQAPSTLVMWCRSEGERGVIDRKVADKVGLVHDELCRIAGQVIEHARTGAPLTLELYDAFENQFDAFITQIRRLQQDVSDTAVAVDAVTGLRTVAGMRSDIKREQDRFDRKGTTFSISCVEIDRLADLQKIYDRRGQDVIYSNVAQIIAKTVRSFDDAYYLGKGEYMIVLKHVDFLDACAVMDRLRHEIELTSIFMPNGEKFTVTASFGVAEALQKESPDIAIEHARAALQDSKGAGGNRVSEFREMSALAQYAKDLNK